MIYVMAESISYFVTSQVHRELDDIAGEPVVFKWKNFPWAHDDAAASGGPDDDEKKNESKVHPRDFKARIIFVSMYHDIDCTQQHNEDTRRQNSS